MATEEITQTAARTTHRGRPPTAGLREAILHAAELIFSRQDFHEVLMEDVARACGVGKGTIYRYFPGKRELYVAVMFEAIDSLREKLRAALDTRASRSSRWNALFAAF